MADFLPAVGKIEEGRALLWVFVEVANEIYVQSSVEPHAIGSCSDLSTLTCPHCRASLDLDLDTHDEWWYETQCRINGTNPLSASIRMPCCGSEPLISELDLGDDMQFGCFHFEVDDPLNFPLTEAQLEELEAHLGCKMTCSGNYYT